jgi:hypothetical protein
LPNPYLKLSKIEDWCRHMLGKTSVAVELEPEDFRKAILETTIIYNRWRPQRMKTKLDISSAQKKYHIDHHNLQGVSDVEFIRASVVSGQIDPFDPSSVIHYPFSMGGGETFGTYNDQLAYQEDARRIASAEPEWFGQWEVDETTGEAKYYLYISIPQGVTYDCSYVYTWHVDPDNKPHGLQHVSNGDVDWFLRYVLAAVKEPLARIRGKFHGIPMPDGGEEDNDYSELSAEGREDREKLLEEIKLRAPPITVIIG